MMNQKGFTLIEILMVVMLVAILAAVSIPQFIDFRVDAKNAAVNSSIGTLRTAIINQYAQSILRCGAAAGTYATAVQLTANDVTSGAGAPCTAAQITNAAERQFVGSAAIPDNPWSGGAVKNTVIACTAGAGCTQNDNTDCAGAAYTAASSGWCYDKATGKIWANSQNNGGAAGAKEDMY
jgi:prepilin-type N-terminal cleavage/methylation domain-containing protein